MQRSMLLRVYRVRVNWTAFLIKNGNVLFYTLTWPFRISCIIQAYCSHCNVLSLFTCYVDVIIALKHDLDAQWREFGTHLRVEPALMDRISKDQSNVGDCMLQLLEKWLTHENGTGRLPRTWATVVQAVKDTGKALLAQTLAEQHGVQLSGQWFESNMHHVTVLWFCSFSSVLHADCISFCSSAFLYTFSTLLYRIDILCK